MRRDLQFMILALACVVVVGVAAGRAGSTFKPKDGFVPNEDVAIKIAVAVWEPIYGTNEIVSEKPYQAHLKDGIWIVEGTLPVGSVGGVAEARISKDDGTIFSVTHGQ